MSAELSIAIKVGATVGGAVSMLRTLVGGTRDLRQTTQLLQHEYRSLGQSISRMSVAGGADLQRLQQRHEALGRSMRILRRHSARQTVIQTRLAAERDKREQMRSEVMGVVAGVGTVIVPVKAAMDF